MVDYQGYIPGMMVFAMCLGLVLHFPMFQIQMPLNKEMVGWLRVGVDDALLFVLILILEVFLVSRAISPTLAILCAVSPGFLLRRLSRGP